MRRVFLLVAVVVFATVTGCATSPGQRPGTPEPQTTAAVLLAVPNVVGENAAVAVDQLTKVGFTDIDLGTVDGRRMVILPQNWTVKTQSARPGSRLAPDDKIVLGCARNG